MRTAKIEMHHVTKSYRETVAVQDVTFDVTAGEFTTILGPSGSGKTTMLNLIAGLVAPTAGRISINGRDVTYLPPAQRNIGLVFQSYALFPHMSIYENIAFPLRVRRLDEADIGKRVEEVLALVRLPEYARRRPSQLSGGQQQRVAIARALVFRPDILLLDEPLAALDRKLREEVRGEIRQIQRQVGITTILVTHDQEEALSLSDRVIVLDRGQVQQIATPEEIYYRPANRTVAAFLGDANFLNERTAENDSDQSGRGVSAPVPEGHSGARARSAACAMLRPERVRLASHGVDPCRVAIVKERVFLGQSIRYRVQTRQGEEMVAVSMDYQNLYEPGSEVSLWWRPEDVWVLPPEACPSIPVERLS